MSTVNFGFTPSMLASIAAGKTKPPQTLTDLRLAKFVTKCTVMLDMLQDARAAALDPDRYPVLIQGESGTGKETLAEAMLGSLSSEYFHPVNCAGFPDTLFESILFGYRKGAFTGATDNKDGILVRAGTGVVFFDEVGELPLTQQAKLLRALQSRRVLPIGALEEVPINCRFVFATNRDLKEMMENYVHQRPGLAFRDDLYYRISALTLHITPLRQRPDDAALIAASICGRLDMDPDDLPPIPSEVINSRGNVRALENWLLQIKVFGIKTDKPCLTGTEPA